MKYFKLENDKGIIGVITSDNFISYTNEMGYIRSSDQYGEYVEYNNKYYRDTWMKTPHILFEYEEVSVFPISENGYHTYVDALKTEEVIREEEEEEEESIISQEEVSTEIEWLRATKTNQMSRACREVIENGFDLELRGEIKHFSLSTQD